MALNCDYNAIDSYLFSGCSPFFESNIFMTLLFLCEKKLFLCLKFVSLSLPFHKIVSFKQHPNKSVLEKRLLSKSIFNCEKY